MFVNYSQRIRYCSLFSLFRKVYHIDHLVTFLSRKIHYKKYKLPHWWYSLKIQRQNWQL